MGIFYADPLSAALARSGEIRFVPESGLTELRGGAKPHQTGNPAVTADNPIAALLAAPVGPDWSVEGLAERVLSAIATHSSEEGHEFVLDANTTTDRQSRRALRPLLACLAVKSAAEAGTSPNLYGGELSFKRCPPRRNVGATRC